MTDKLREEFERRRAAPPDDVELVRSFLKNHRHSGGDPAVEREIRRLAANDLARAHAILFALEDLAGGAGDDDEIVKLVLYAANEPLDDPSPAGARAFLGELAQHVRRWLAEKAPSGLQRIRAREAALEADVLRRPADDAPRRALGTSLDQRGEPRGRFILAQLEHNGLRRKGFTAIARYRELETEIERLRPGLATTFAAQVAGLARDPRCYRGFVDAVTIDVSAFIAHAGELYARVPVLHVRITDVAGRVEALAASPHLGRLRSLSLAGETIGDAGVAALVASPHVRALRQLDLSFAGVGDAGVEALAAADLPELLHVNLHGNPGASPVETFGADAITGYMNRSSIVPTPLGKRLEAQYGERLWIHAPSLLPLYPPLEGDLV